MKLDDRIIKIMKRKNIRQINIRQINSLDEMDTEDIKELERLQVEDILERYNHEEYWNPDITWDFLKEKGYKLPTASLQKIDKEL